MKILVGSVLKADVIEDTMLSIESIKFVYEGKQGLNMVFSCDCVDEKATVRLVKDILKERDELGGLFYNVSVE